MVVPTILTIYVGDAIVRDISLADGTFLLKNGGDNTIYLAYDKVPDVTLADGSDTFPLASGESVNEDWANKLYGSAKLWAICAEDEESVLCIWQVGQKGYAYVLDQGLKG